jgi:hypothetical protein
MADPIFDSGPDPLETTPLNSEVWLCPQCNSCGDLIPVAEGVLLRCGTCGFQRRGKPAPNFDVE